jgi:hypothetical protein
MIAENAESAPELTAARREKVNGTGERFAGFEQPIPL